ncbi:hypothetical protein A3D85_00900 [Candidatus Amesbacteria bacterium RIFCSPHIGHO2_02_FULL_47_9]|uniref:phosphoglycerate kinase n=1 Tax=Candidatus Amesbacteria bacterium RIFCSPHIGHO2_01_FULL_48_32b TaxID=1797253 RepID=A0A1F4YCG2_9BACT|nr:MAG: hypothetical protein A2876_03610 [Candidatus Amesbacteria bacterium RIFCSPHIGHO2_01_FULL_48_32b]OGD04598.1 MAG: hypothetical protein A3D85_00900 [Candidatus Amesbacteria bacterium RIFCSPHIGHO2_02_FULL_47_9]OGD06773.1 MAG: hypothetical protein A2899_05310 [Candidatus Amesbacteria bacterium RIFCSPLOWO2_01_FULL_49_25]
MSGKFLKSIRDVEVGGKSVLVRGDLDVDDGDNPRVRAVREVINLLGSRSAGRVKVIGHRETNYDICVQLRGEFGAVEFDDRLRDNRGEKENSEEFARQLADGWDVYVNEAFATSHRKHASIDALPRLMAGEGKQVCVGERFYAELEKLDEVWTKVGRKVLVIGGVKVEDKQKFAETMENRFSAVLKGGLLPGIKLRPDGLDISDKLIEEYEKTIAGADVILAAGVMGKYEDEGASEGTRRVLLAITNNGRAYKIAGGGDIEMAISKYGLTEKFDWISVGGGAMLEYLATGTLVGIEALV